VLLLATGRKIGF
jgi:hypothetical protein